MSVSKSLHFETDVPPYQRDMIEWLRGYRNTAELQELLRRCRFSQEELEKYRRAWAMWLAPKRKTRSDAFH